MDPLVVMDADLYDELLRLAAHEVVQNDKAAANRRAARGASKKGPGR